LKPPLALLVLLLLLLKVLVPQALLLKAQD